MFLKSACIFIFQKYIQNIYYLLMKYLLSGIWYKRIQGGHEVEGVRSRLNKTNWAITARHAFL
jgi:hypothetical protein